MKQIQWLQLLCLGALLGTVSAWNGLSDETNPYLSIVERNPFNLNDLPKPPEAQPPPEAPKPPSPKVRLTGITSLFSKRKALIEITDPTGAKKVTPLIMVEGESKEGVELVSINMEKNEVVMKIDGETSTIGFETPESTPAPNPAGPGPGGKGTGTKPGTKVTPNSPRPTATGSASAYPNPAASNPTGGGAPVVISSRGNNASQGGGVTVAGAASSYGPVPGAPSYAPGATPVPGPSYNATATAEARQYNNSNTRVVPSRNNRTDPVQQQSTGHKLSPEEIRELMIKRKAVSPNLPYPMPPQDQRAVMDILSEK